MFHIVSSFFYVFLRGSVVSALSRLAFRERVVPSSALGKDFRDPMGFDLLASFSKINSALFCLLLAVARSNTKLRFRSQKRTLYGRRNRFCASSRFCFLVAGVVLWRPWVPRFPALCLSLFCFFHHPMTMYGISFRKHRMDREREFVGAKLRSLLSAGSMHWSHAYARASRSLQGHCCTPSGSRRMKKQVLQSLGATHIVTRVSVDVQSLPFVGKDCI